MAALPVWSKHLRANGPRSVAGWSTSLRDAPRETIAAQLADEIFVSDGFPEAGYEGDRRVRLHSVAQPARPEIERRSSSSRVSPS